MKTIERSKTKQRVKKIISKEEYWEKLPEDKRDNFLEFATDIFVDELDEIQNLLKKRNEWLNNGVVLIIGIFIGITGGLVANIIHSLLLPYGFYYYVPAILSFILFFYWLFSFIKNTNKPEDSNENWKKFIGHVVEKYKREKENK